MACEPETATRSPKPADEPAGLVEQMQAVALLTSLWTEGTSGLGPALGCSIDMLSRSLARLRRRVRETEGC